MTRPLLVPQAPPGLPAGRGGRPFLRRYAADTVRRLRGYAAIRTPVTAAVLHADARKVDLPDRIDGVVTSPPYPGVIDYHEQHRYAYELLGLEDRRQLELGAAAAGSSRRALAAYCDGMVEALDHTRRHLRMGAPVAIVANDRHDLFDGIAERAGYRLVDSCAAARQPAHRPPLGRVLRAGHVAHAGAGSASRVSDEAAWSAKRRSSRNSGPWKRSPSIRTSTTAPHAPGPPCRGTATTAGH